MSKEMTKTASRRALHAYVSDEAHDAWHDFAAENGVTVSGLLEALTLHLKGADLSLSIGEAWEASVKSARAVDARRRRRS